MTPADEFMLAIVLYREARGEGRTGMLAVGCVVRNRVDKRHSTYYAECVKPWAFSSITAKGDSQLIVWPKESESEWQTAQLLAQGILSGAIQDITGGATLYWAPASIESGKKLETPLGLVTFPAGWSLEAVKYAATIGNHVFLTEA